MSPNKHENPAFILQQLSRKLPFRVGIAKTLNPFSYPAHRSKSECKLRIYYESAPVSDLTEFAAGKSSDYENWIPDISTKNLTLTSAFCVGNASLVKELEIEIASG